MHEYDRTELLRGGEFLLKCWQFLALPQVTGLNVCSKTMRVSSALLCNLRTWTTLQDSVVNINLALTHSHSLAVWHHSKRSFLWRCVGKPQERKIIQNSFLRQGMQEKYEQNMNSCSWFFFSGTSTHPGSYSNKIWLCLLIMGCKYKNVLLCQKSRLLVDKFVDIPPLQTASSLNVTVAHYSLGKAMEYLWKSF